MNYYQSPDPDVIDNFNLMYNKKEFQLPKNKIEYKFADTTYSVYQEPFQLLLQNYVSQFTPYNSILLYNGLGTGKTCSAISIAEGFKNYVRKMNRKIIVLVKNKNIEKNFINELCSECSNGEYNKKDPNIRRIINNTYDIMTYGTFQSRVIGQRKQGSLLEKSKEIVRIQHSDQINDVSNCVVIIDEVQNITNNEYYTAIFNILKKSVNYKLVLLSATPVYDNPKEIVEINNLLNANNKKYILPIRKDLYTSGLIRKEYKDNIKLKTYLNYFTDDGLNIVRNAMKGKVSYLAINVDTNPVKIDMGEPIQPDKKGSVYIVKCKMSKYQYDIYKRALLMDVKVTKQNKVNQDTNDEFDEDEYIKELENPKVIFEIFDKKIEI